MLISRFGTAIGLVLLSTQLAQANFQKGQEALDQNNAAVAVDEWQQDAHSGDGRAQFALGQIFEKGSGDIKADLVKAYSWFKLAAAQNVKGADEAMERLRQQMTPDELAIAEKKAIASLGVWYRQYAGADEAAFQAQKAATASEAPKQEDAGQSATEARLAAQKAMIAERKAKAEAEAKLIEESRKAAILAAQKQAEEAKQAALLKEQKIAEERRLAAAQNEAGKSKDLDAIRTRLEALKAKQSGIATTNPPVAKVPVPTVNETKLAEPAPAAKPEAKANTQAVAKAPAAPKAETEQKIAMVEKEVAPAAGGKLATASMKPEAVAPKASGIASAAKPAVSEQKLALAETPKSDADVIPEKINLNGLDKQAVKEIFEASKVADLNSPEAKSEIADSLARIDALKWSLISGAKGDKAAPVMNKVLMSKMTPVQIAEANRLAGEWLIERQSRL